MGRCSSVCALRSRLLSSSELEWVPVEPETKKKPAAAAQKATAASELTPGPAPAPVPAPALADSVFPTTPAVSSLVCGCLCGSLPVLLEGRCRELFVLR